MIKELKPKSVIVATEGKTNLRDQMSGDYKAGRTLPQPFSQQIPYIYNICKLYGWHILEVDGYEADDSIAAVGRKLKEAGKRGVVFTTDKDIISRVTPDTGIVAVFMREKGKSYVLEAADYLAKWGVPTHQIPEILCLCGDSVDNVPGVKGIGKSSATALIQTYGTVDNVLANLDKVTPARVKALLSSPEGQESLKLSQSLIQLNDQLPVPEEFFSTKPIDYKGLEELFLSLDMRKTAEGIVGEKNAQEKLNLLDNVL
jgi:DNA polymerase-1